MDTGSGDADCGSTLCRGAKKLKSVIGENGDALAKNPAILLREIGQVSEKEMGGSSGAMFSLFFEAAASELANAISVSHHSITEALKAGSVFVIIVSIYLVLEPILPNFFSTLTIFYTFLC